MTANVMPEDVERFLAAGMNGHIAKPIEPQVLWQALARWVRPSRRPPAANAGDAGTGQEAGRPLPAGVPGLDVEAGLRRVLGKQALYAQLLVKFLAGQRQACAAIRKALDAQDHGLAERLAHTCKGVAGSLGAGGIQEAAGQLESAIGQRQPRARLDELLAQLDAQLQPVLGALEAWSSPPQPVAPGTAAASPASAAPAVNFDGAAFRAACAQLRQYLAAGDARAEALVTDQGALLRAGLGGAYAPLQRAVQDFDFELALTQLPAEA
jgi:two-component system sensor histidine kinase/response regulator